MLQRFLLITITLCSLTASAQWQQTGSKVRYVTGIGIPTKDTAAGVSADSSQILIRPADSSLYVKYKRTWQRVGGGTISGTTNYIPKFTSSSAIGNSQIFDNGTNVGIGTASPWEALSIPFNSKLSFGSSTYPLSISRSIAGDLVTTISDNYDVSNTRIDFVMRNGTANQNTPLSLLSSGNVGIGTTSPIAKLSVQGTTLINTNTDNGVDKLQVSGDMSVSAKATAQNLSVTNSAQITNNLDMGSGTANTNITILTNGTSSGWAGRMVGEYATGQFYFQHRNNTPTWTTCFLINANGGKGNTYFYDNAFVSGDGFLTVNGSTNNGVDKLQVVGSASITGMKQAYIERTTTYTATTSDYLIDCTSGTFTVNLFAASGNTGRIIIVKNSGAGTITVDGNASETIDGAATYSLSAQYATVQLMCDGTNWKIISKF